MKKMILTALILIGILFCSGYSFAHGNQDTRGGGGPNFGVIFLNLDGLNSALAVQGFEPLGKVLFISGGGGLGGEKAGLRVGGSGCGGGVSAKNPNGDEVSLGMGYGGFVLEKGYYVSGKTDIAIGTMLGGGGAGLEIVRANGDKEKFGKGFIVIEPRLNAHRQVTQTMGIELIVSYLFTYDFGAAWEINPGSEVTSHFMGGPRVVAGVTFGF